MTSYATFATASVICLVALLLLQLGTYIVGRRIGRFNIVDVTWGAGFAVVALVGVTYLVVHEVPELLTVIEDVLYMVTGDEYDLRSELGLDERA